MKIKFLIKCLPVLIILLNSQSSFSQGLKQFSSDQVKFLEEFQSFLQEATTKKTAEKYIEKFMPFWNSTSLSTDDREMIYRHCNQMLKKRLKASPDFTNYFEVLMHFNSGVQNNSSYMVWKNTVNNMIGEKAIKNFNDFIILSHELFFQKILYSSSTTKWATSSGDYYFANDSLPKLIFKELTLKCYAKGDSALIYKTKGTYYPTISKWYGDGGVVNWKRAGFNENDVYAEIGKYQVNFKSPTYKVDSVVFYDKNYFTKPLIGHLEEKILADVSEENASYPRFDSYDKRIKINNISPNIDYDGGFSLYGAKFIGSGNKDEDAHIYFKRNDMLFFKVASKSFVIRKDKFTAQRVRAFIYLDKDSIFHPGLVFKYIIASKELSLIRDDEGIAKSPYFNSYHNVDMYFEALYWKTDEPLIDMKMILGASQGKASFESASFYKEKRYRKIQGMDAIHPFIPIRDFSKKMNARDFLGTDLAVFMKVTMDQLKPQLIQFSNQGFIKYDIEEDLVIVQDRLIDYINNKSGKKDYDVIEIVSEISGKANASLNLLSNELTIRGVSEIQLSDSQNVFVYPSQRQIILKKNRNFSFGGVVVAGRLDLHGKDFNFEYDNFRILLNSVDSVRMKAPGREMNNEGKYDLVRVKTNIEDVNGEILIDKPFNKSGVQIFPEYPILNSKKDSYVYYSKKNILQGVYPKDRFYFHLDPFSMDSLDNFTKEGLNFQGDFVSAGILPDFRETLRLQDDYSLGFTKRSPAGGFPLYGGKGTFDNDIKLSNQGLRGNGEIKYVTSTTKSNDFIFYPDSMNTNSQSFVVKDQDGPPEFPPVKGEGNYIHWMPYKDVMQTFKREKFIDFFNGQAEFHGRTDLSPDGLSGDGRIDFTRAQLFSTLMKFKRTEFFADTAEFKLSGADLSGVAFSTKNVNAHVDFKNRTGEFKANGGGSFVEFPTNQYICYMDQFKWFMDKESIEMTSDNKVKSDSEENSDIDLTGTEFISVHPKQDSLRFVAPRAKYDLRKYKISAQDVKYINVADSRIYPDSGNVVVEKKAVIQTLMNSKILANSTTRYHNIYNATVDIFARRSYNGTGDYDYQDEIKRKQNIHFDVINVDTTGQTYAEGKISEDKNFTLSPNFDYKGNVRLNASNRYLTFSGTTRLQHKCDNVKKSWFRFTTEINPEEIYIPVDTVLLDENNDKISAGLMLTKDSTHIYSAFLSKKNVYSDIDVLPGIGYLFFDRNSREYKISSREKLQEISLPGNYVSFHSDNCNIYGEGNMHLGPEYGQVKVNTVGNVKLNPDSIFFDLLMSVDFFFDENALKLMGEDFAANPNLTPVNFSRTTYERGLSEMVGKDLADKLIAQLNLNGSFKRFPSELVFPLFLTDLKLKWNTPSKSYISVGSIGIGNIYKNEINKLVKGKVELVKKNSGDVLNIYFEVEGGNWYYFNYQRGLMQAISSNEKFNTSIKEFKSDKKKPKAEKGDAPYTFMLSTIAKKNNFMKGFETTE